MADATVPYLNSADTPSPAARPALDVPDELVSHYRYRIMQILGAGGMGVVYKAEHRMMERLVALKVINRSLTAKAKAADRFRVEVRAAAKLVHPNIVTAYDADEAGDLHFLVMEFVEGVSLAHYVERKGPIPQTQACHFVRQVALGLQHAHEKGMVHRDIKPHNLMITRKGVVKILDFGLARFATESNFLDESEGVTFPGSQDGALTAASTVIGTPDFLAPEQAKNSHTVDIRADIYSLGCTLYYLLTGLPPFPTGSALEKLMAHWEREPAPIVGLDPAVAVVLQKMMAKNADERYQTPAEVAAALLPLARLALPSGERKVVPLASATLSEAPTEMEIADVAVSVEETPLPAKKHQRLDMRTPAGGWRTRKKHIVLTALAGCLVWTAILAALPNKKPPDDEPQQGAATNAAANGTGPRVLLVVPQKFWQPDYTPLRQTLDDNGARVTVASTSLTACEGMSLPGPRRKPSESVKPDVLIERVQAKDYDAIVFIGHEVADLTRDNSQGKAVRQLLQEMDRLDRVIGGLCVGQKVLATHGILRGKTAALPEEMGKWGNMTAANTPVAVDGNLVTGRSPTEARDFALALLKLLAQKRESVGSKAPLR